MAQTSWKTYFGEAPEAHSSDDDDYHDGKANGYTRAEARERDRKWAEIKAFEAARTLNLVTTAQHRGLCRSVRPVDGAEAVVSYEVRDKGDALLKAVKRQVVTVGANDAHLDDVLRELRRGERARVAFDDKTLDVTLHFVRAERAIAPRQSPWAPLIQGACRSKRVALGASSQRPRWGDTVTVRVDDRAAQRVVLGGAHDLGEGVEAVLLGMKAGEACEVVASGEFGSGRCCVALDEIEAGAPENNAEGARRVAVESRARGLTFVEKNEWRRAEAVFSRALGALEENLDLLKVEDRRDIESEVVAPLFLDIAACARRRRGFSDEDVCLTKALGLAVERAGGAARARVLLRRGSARADLERFAEAKDDLKRAAQDARTIAIDSNASTDARKDMRDAYEACRAELERLVRHRKEQKAREKAGLFGGLDRAFADVVEVTDDKPPKPPPLLYEKEIETTLRKKQPWNHDPRYYDVQRAPHVVPPPAEKIRTDDLSKEFEAIDEAETEQAKLSSMLRQNVVMQQMYDCNGTGRRGKPSSDPEYMGGGMVA